MSHPSRIVVGLIAAARRGNNAARRILARLNAGRPAALSTVAPRPAPIDATAAALTLPDDAADRAAAAAAARGAELAPLFRAYFASRFGPHL